MQRSIAAGAVVATLLAGLVACGGKVDEPQPAVASAPASRPAEIRLSARAAQGPQRAASAGVAAADDSPSLAEQVAQLRREVVELRLQIARLPGAARAGVEIPNPRTDPSARAMAERAEQMRIASAETAFQREASSNPQWSQSTARDIRTTLIAADPTLGEQIRSVECRSQTCRVVFHPDAGANSELPITLSQLSETLPRVTAAQVDQGDGRMATVIYLTR